MNRSEIVLEKHKGKIALVLAVLLFGFLCVPVARAAEKVPRAVLRSADSVVRVVATSSREISSGTGFVIKNGRDASYVATNHHVVEGMTESVGVYLDQDTFVEAQIVADSAQSDCCILKTSERLPMRAVTLTTRASRGDAIYAVGFPGAADNLSMSVATLAREATITDGIISAVRTIQVTASGKDVTMYQINADINHGNSGGPLFDVKGRVIGMNTYGWVGGSGINGAIAIEETIALAKENGVKVKTGGAAFFIAAACAITAALVLAAVVVGTMVIIKKKHREGTRVRQRKTQTLREWMEAYPQGMGYGAAAQLLLPLVTQIEKLHKKGKLCLALSPDTVLVRYGKTYFEKKKKSGYGLAHGFAAPECYAGEELTKATDVYAVCALLSYAACGKLPPHAMKRRESAAPTKSPFAAMVRAGMRLNAQMRTQDLTNVIACLREYEKHKQKAVHGKHENTALAIVKPRKKNTKRRIWIATACMIAAVLLIYGGTYFAAVKLSENGSFKTAQKLIFVPFVTNLHDPQFTAYLSAGCAMEDHDFDTAQETFEALGDYRSSKKLLDGMLEREVRYLMAEQRFSEAVHRCKQLDDKELKGQVYYEAGLYYLYQMNDCEWAAGLLSKAQNFGYDVAPELLAEANYGWAVELIDRGYYIQAFRRLDSAKEYEKTGQLRETLQETIYSLGIDAYHTGQYSEALDLFQCITPYERSEDYLTLVQARNCYWFENTAGHVQKLKELFYFEDAADILLTNDSLLKEYLLGAWYTSDGYYYFTMTREDRTSYNLPWFDFGDYYRFNNGVYELCRESDGASRPLFEFTLLSPDSINVYCYQNGRTYTLYRG